MVCHLLHFAKVGQHTLTTFPAGAVGVAVEWYTPHTYHTPTDFPAGAVGVAGIENPLEWYTHHKHP